MDKGEHERLMNLIDPKQVIGKAIHFVHVKSPMLIEKAGLTDLAGTIISPSVIKSPQHLMAIIDQIILRFERFGAFRRDAETANLMSKFAGVKSNMKKLREQSARPGPPRPKFRKNFRRGR